MPKELNATDVANIIYEAIEAEPHLNKPRLIPVIVAVIKAYIKANANVIVSPKENKYRYWADKKEAESRWWMELARKLDPDNMEQHYKEQNKHLANLGYAKDKHS